MNILKKFCRRKDDFGPIIPWDPIPEQQFRSSSVRVNFMAALMLDPTFRQALGVLQHSIIVSEPAKDSTAERELGRSLGRQESLMLIYRLSMPLPAEGHSLQEIQTYEPETT